MSVTSMKKNHSQARKPSTSITNKLAGLPVPVLKEMLVAGHQVEAAVRSLDKAGLNLVGECLKGQGEFYEYDHYPEHDVYDNESHSQYYFHTHRGINGEYGHFHTFLRFDGMPASIQPLPNEGEEEWPGGKDAVSGLICISMNRAGLPIGLFTVNRWVCGDTWYKAEDVIRMLDYFSVDHAMPNLAVNQWITAIFRLFKPDMVELLLQRDEKIAAWRQQHPGIDVLEDRNLEITSSKKLNVKQQIKAIERALKPNSH